MQYLTTADPPHTFPAPLSLGTAKKSTKFDVDVTKKYSSSDKDDKKIEQFSFWYIYEIQNQ